MAPLPSGPLLLLLAAVFAVAPAQAEAHGGGLDKLGCHRDGKRGGYHCHQGRLAGQTFTSRADALKTLESGGKK